MLTVYHGSTYRVEQPSFVICCLSQPLQFEILIADCWDVL